MSKSKKEIQPFWRPNFVNQAELPDIKVIRTNFIINFVAVMVALSVVFLLLQDEYHNHVLKQTVSGMEQRVRDAQAVNAASLKMSQSFRESAQAIVEVERFFRSPLSQHQFLYDLSGLKPADLIFNSISLSESIVPQDKQKVLEYHINIDGDAKNLAVIENFKRALEKADILKFEGFNLTISETLQGRDEKTGIFPYRLAITLKPVGKAAKEGGAE